MCRPITHLLQELLCRHRQAHRSNQEADKPPKEMETLEERIRSRFEWGLMADIGTPDYETRMAILRKKAETDNFDIDDDIGKLSLSDFHSDVSMLEIVEG